LQRIHTVARLLDEQFRVPGTSFRFGFDSLIGLIPGVGDLAAASIALYLVHEARQLGASKWTLMKMLGNTGIDLLIGSIPLAGDLFDFGFKSNKRNARLLEQHLSGK
jgi:hypothetical protein